MNFTVIFTEKFYPCKDTLQNNFWKIIFIIKYFLKLTNTQTFHTLIFAHLPSILSFPRVYPFSFSIVCSASSLRGLLILTRVPRTVSLSSLCSLSFSLPPFLPPSLSFSLLLLLMARIISLCIVRYLRLYFRSLGGEQFYHCVGCWFIG